jgi:hypothetical protein
MVKNQIQKRTRFPNWFCKAEIIEPLAAIPSRQLLMTRKLK